MDAFALSELILQVEKSGQPYLEFFRVTALSLGLYRLPAGGTDPQQSHTEDEIYYVLRGRAEARVGAEDREVRPGTLLFVPAGVEHRFHHIQEDLTLLVAFAPAEGSQAREREEESEPFHRVRRADRAVEDEGWIRALLRRAPFGALATLAGGQPFINTNLFVFDEAGHAIYLHTAREGRTRTNLERDDRVCFSVSEMGRLLPADTALEMSVEYAGVVVFGRGRIVADLAEARRGLQLLLDKYCPHLRPGRDYRPITDEELSRTSVYRVDILSWSGKKKEAPADFPGAFHYGQGQPGAGPSGD